MPEIAVTENRKKTECHPKPGYRGGAILPALLGMHTQRPAQRTAGGRLHRRS